MNKIKIFSLSMSLILLLSTILFSVIYFKVLFPLNYTNEIKCFAEKYHIEAPFVASLINEESSFDRQCVSRSGAVGLMQLMPRTAEWIAEKMNFANFSDEMLFDPVVNISIGTCYLNYLMDKFDDLFTVLCAYNAGEGVVSMWLKNKEYSSNGKTLDTVPFKETDSYAKKVLRNIDRYKTRFSVI